jgi:hypothetical protein
MAAVDIRRVSLMRKLIEIGLLIVSLPMLMGSEVYRWVDPNGVVNFTQLKPRGVQAQHISTGSAGTSVIGEVTDQPVGAPGAGEPAAEGQLSSDQQNMLKGLQAAEQARRDEVARIKTANCEKSRSVLNRLSGTERIRVRDNDGAERIMEESERQQRISDAQRGISENCTS